MKPVKAYIAIRKSDGERQFYYTEDGDKIFTYDISPDAFCNYAWRKSEVVIRTAEDDRARSEALRVLAAAGRRMLGSTLGKIYEVPGVKEALAVAEEAEGEDGSKE